MVLGRVLVTFLERAFFLRVTMRRSSKSIRYISDGLLESSSVSGPSMRIWRRGDTMRRSHGCFDSAAFAITEMERESQMDADSATMSTVS